VAERSGWDKIVMAVREDLDSGCWIEEDSTRPTQVTVMDDRQTLWKYLCD
jgi:hypothetical protein